MFWFLTRSCLVTAEGLVVFILGLFLVIISDAKIIKEELGQVFGLKKLLNKKEAPAKDHEK